MSHQDYAIGIDLGTTYCAAAIFQNGKFKLIRNRDQGSSRVTPSYVSYHNSGDQTYGNVAKDQAYKFPERTVFDAKRMIGRSFKDKQLQEDMKTWPFNVVNVKDMPKIKIDRRTIYPQEVSAVLLKKICRLADEYLQAPLGSVKKVVITVPAYFSEGQRRATLEAGEAAGLQVLGILNEPTAAAIACEQHRTSKELKTVLMYDLGGGTFDVSIIKISQAGVKAIGVDGDTHLGGEDFDQLLLQHCAEEFKKKHQIDLFQNTADGKRAIARLRNQCEKAKQDLSSSNSTQVDLPAIWSGSSGWWPGSGNPVTDLNVSITRETFEKLIEPLVQKTINIVARLIKGVGGQVKSIDEIDDVVLVGGSTRIPLVKSLLSKFFKNRILNYSVDPDAAVAYGAAFQAALLNAASKEKARATSKDNEFHMPTEKMSPKKELDSPPEKSPVKSFEPIAAQKHAMSSKKSLDSPPKQRFEPSPKKALDSPTGEDCERYGEKTFPRSPKASSEVESPVKEKFGLSRRKALDSTNVENLEKFRIEDVTPMTLGIYLDGDEFGPIIPRNQPIPCEFTEEYTTSIDNQKEFLIEIYQGENKIATTNEKLGEFSLSGIPPGPVEQEAIKITMKIDINGILAVTAVSQNGAKTSSLQVTDDRFRMEKEVIEELRGETHNLNKQILNK